MPAKKAKVLIKNLGSASGKAISTADAKAIRGGEYRCPSRECKTLVVKIVTAARAKKHTVIIDSSV